MSDPVVIKVDQDKDTYESVWVKIFEEFFEKDANNVLVSNIGIFMGHDIENTLNTIEAIDRVSNRLRMPGGVSDRCFRVEETPRGLLITRDRRIPSMPRLTLPF